MYFDRSQNCIQLSVRELCLLANKGGSLDNRLPPKSLYLRAVEGREVHDKLRAGRGSDWHSEVMLTNRCRLGNVEFCVSGRADSVLYEDNGACTVEEIKSVSAGAEVFAGAPRGADLSQLSCYGYFLCASKHLPTVTLRLTYAVPGREENAAHVDSVMTADALRELYVSMLQVILPQAEDLVLRGRVVRDACREALFPYPSMRAAQEDMIRELWRDMRQGQTVFAQAPTGIGKTISTLYPALRCLGADRADKIFYLTAKSAARREAFGAAERMVTSGTPIRACVITARESACICESARLAGGRLSGYCNPSTCPYAKGYYDRVDGVIARMLANEKGLFSGLVIRRYAEEAQVCPYELALDLSERCEVIICDYNYVFSPSVYLRRYLSDGIPHTPGSRFLFLVDEAHNLVDRARDMYSGSLSLADVVSAQDVMNDWEESFRKNALFPDEDAPAGSGELHAVDLDDLIGTLSRMTGRCAETMTTGSDGVRRGVSLDRSAPVELTEAVLALSKKLDVWLRRHASHPLYPSLDQLAGSLRSFRTAADYYDEKFVTFTEAADADVIVRLVCLDPSGILRPILRKAEARVLFSATLTPADYFADVLGGDEDSVRVAFDSPFDPSHLCIAVGDHVSTRFDDREKSVRRVVNYIAAAVSVRHGNYMVYFPSYSYLEKVSEAFSKRYPKVKTVVQKAGMSAAERDAFIAAFRPDSTSLQIGFCVLGGSFSEGVDLPGNCLIGAVIVGVGIPGLSNERNIMKEYYDETREGEGYAYAYTYPGMNHVLQAAGRVIRRADDRGVVILLDDRYVGEPYLHLFPDHWQNIRAVGDAPSLAEYLRAFWNGSGTGDGNTE